MYIHEEIQALVIPLMRKYDLELIDLIGEMAHAMWELSPLTNTGIDVLEARLEKKGGV